MKKAGLQTFYSLRSKEPKFGTFIRLIFGLPFVRIDDLNRGMKNIERISQMLNEEKCKNFATDVILYVKAQWINGSVKPELWNMFMHNGARTNNYCEGYNYKLGAKKMLHKHPNVYILASSIRDELIVSQDNALVQIMGGAQKQGKKKYEKLRERQEKMMKHYAAGNTDLYTYQLSMGAMSLSNSKAFKGKLELAG